MGCNKYYKVKHHEPNGYLPAGKYALFSTGGQLVTGATGTGSTRYRHLHSVFANFNL